MSKQKAENTLTIFGKNAIFGQNKPKFNESLTADQFCGTIVLLQICVCSLISCNIPLLMINESNLLLFKKPRLCLSLLIYILFPVDIQAQTACFTADMTRSCAPLTIQITDCSIAPAINPRAYKYSEAEGFVQRTTHTYTQPGRYSITQIVQLGSGSADSLRKTDYIEVLPSPPPTFSVRLCANREIALEIPDTQYEQYIINWGDGTPNQIVAKGAAPTRHTYLSTASFSVKVRGNYIPGNCGGENAQLVTPILALIPAEIKSVLTKTRNAFTGSIEIQAKTNANFRYEVYLNGNATPVAAFAGIDGTITQSIENINTETQTQCIKIRTIDACGGVLDTADDYCHIGLQVTAQDSQNQIRWSLYPDSFPAGIFRQYVLYRNNQPLQIFTNINQSSYLDTDVICQQNYCYQIAAEFSSPSIDFTSNSNTVCVNAFSGAIPPVITDLNSTVESGRSIKVFWKVNNEPKIDHYIIRRGTTEFVSQTTTQSVIDADLMIDRPFCYTVNYTNICDNTAPFSAQTCPVFLQGTMIEAGKAQLQWTTYRNAASSYQSYVLEKLDENYAVYQEFPLSNSIVQFTDASAKTDRQVLRYRVKTIVNADIVSYSNIIELKQTFRIFFPNAFRPSSAVAENTVFKPKGLFINQFKMVIYNRAGEILFTTTNLDTGWDGNFKGKEVPQDTYIYAVELADFIGEKFSTRGTFVLLR